MCRSSAFLFACIGSDTAGTGTGMTAGPDTATQDDPFGIMFPLHNSDVVVNKSNVIYYSLSRRVLPC